jgi:hypothetical protein
MKREREEAASVGNPAPVMLRTTGPPNRVLAKLRAVARQNTGSTQGGKAAGSKGHGSKGAAKQHQQENVPPGPETQAPTRKPPLAFTTSRAFPATISGPGFATAASAQGGTGKQLPASAAGHAASNRIEAAPAPASRLINLSPVASLPDECDVHSPQGHTDLTLASPAQQQRKAGVTGSQRHTCWLTPVARTPAKNGSTSSSFQAASGHTLGSKGAGVTAHNLTQPGNSPQGVAGMEVEPSMSEGGQQAGGDEPHDSSYIPASVQEPMGGVTVPAGGGTKGYPAAVGSSRMVNTSGLKAQLRQKGSQPRQQGGGSQLQSQPEAQEQEGQMESGIELSLATTQPLPYTATSPEQLPSRPPPITASQRAEARPSQRPP